MAIEILSFPMKNGDFPYLRKRLPEGSKFLWPFTSFHHGRLSKLHPLVADLHLRYLWPGCNCGGCVGECAMDLLKIGRKSEETCFLEEKICRKPWFYWFLTVFQPCFWTEHVLQTMDFSGFYSQTIQISSGFLWLSDFPFNTGILFLWWSIGLLGK